MYVKSMQVMQADAHPNADSLRVYQLSAPSLADLQVVANLENVYAVGDTVAVALLGAKLKDNTVIRRTRLRGVDSYGMIIEHTELPPGSDLSEVFCLRVIDPDEPQVSPWPSIEALHAVRETVAAEAELHGQDLPCLTYRSKIKLDGRNAGVQVGCDGKVICQSRGSVLSHTEDNLGFHHWFSKQNDFFESLALEDEDIVLFGEWCGQGIQKRTAICTIGRKIFAVFAIQVGDPRTGHARMVVEPEAIKEMLTDHSDIYVLPWLPPTFKLNFADTDSLRGVTEKISTFVEEVEKCDPWVLETFEVTGLGEGIVLYPMLEEGPDTYRQTRELMFKAKGEKHKTVKQKKAVQIDPEVARGIDEFAALVVTEARLEQGLTEALSDHLEMKGMGVFLKWLSQDVQKECQAELAVSGLEWAQVSKRVSTVARDWFKSKIETI